MSLTGLAFLLFYATGCLLAFIRHPIYGLITYVATFYLHPPSRWWGQTMPDLRWSLTAALVTTLAVALARKAGPRKSLFSFGVTKVLAMFIGWLIVQFGWALDFQLHLELTTIYVKYLILIIVIYKCIENELHLRLFLFTHVAGCFYLGWIVFSDYSGGRFEGFGGPDIGEANAGAIQIVTGIFIGSALFLAGKFREKIALIFCMPFLVNALVATISRGAFLAGAAGGLIFNYLTPRALQTRVRVLSALALIMFVMLTNPIYWERIASIKHAGEEVEGVDTGSLRVELMLAQLKMFREHPWGCGHRCTAILSTYYLDRNALTTSVDGTMARSSHNTFLTMLVEHGLPGGVIYVLMVLWVAGTIIKLSQKLRATGKYLECLLPGVAAAFGALLLGDMFVDYLKMEIRFWLIVTVLLMLEFAASGTADKGNSNQK